MLPPLCNPERHIPILRPRAPNPELQSACSPPSTPHHDRPIFLTCRRSEPVNANATIAEGEKASRGQFSSRAKNCGANQEVNRRAKQKRRKKSPPPIPRNNIPTGTHSPEATSRKREKETGDSINHHDAAALFLEIDS